MSRSKEAIRSLKEELAQVELARQKLDKRSSEIKESLRIIESLTTVVTNEDLLKFKD